ncbi:L,D-transpeptidase family protein [Sphingomonas sabuli]|uniref:L,D-transpeptidase family protein n=1 Tax=Sphingomonas sabuli TaxID=2764186 RepID=A0A7G9L1K2_9SPHN|nr:L,D-transpeptidase family protein [Sphingomonas sabuli]QNM82501.1 L,D-transpeptidase family protein [Sphingomonas sabuli]
MTMFRNLAAAAVTAALLAGCSTGPRPVAQAPQVPAAAQELPYRWTHGNAPKAYKDAAAAFGPLTLKPGEYRWAADAPKTGEAKVVVDLLQQRFYVYRADRLVGVSTISSGKKGKETPLGLWKVFRKQVKGFSRKYDNAPMPYMQMYDEKGIAFHAGKIPGYPASHGCVRLPLEFAKNVFGVTKVGTEVIIEG